MKASLRLGRLAGIDIGIHYTWLFAFGLIAWSLAEGFFPANYSTWTTATYWGTGVLAALLLFASVLLHELAHSVVARARGLPAHSITLFIFGGVSNIGSEPQRPRDEFIIAVVGPLTSLGIAGVAFGVYQIVRGDKGPLEAVLFYLALANALLAGFNLLPGFPLDGGRVLRSILWGTTRSLRRATNIAAGIGQAFGWALIASGVYLVVVERDFLGGSWIALIGWFLSSAADASRREMRMQTQFHGMRVSEVMDPALATVTPEATVEQLVQECFLRRGCRAMAVSEDGRPVGIVTLTDVKRVPQERWAQARVAEIMTRSPLHSVNPDDGLDAALRLLAEHRLNQLLVLRGERLVGLLSRADIIHSLQFSQELGVRPGTWRRGAPSDDAKGDGA
jgi:Zn-dependent protease/CBS domain-containing protein